MSIRFIQHRTPTERREEAVQREGNSWLSVRERCLCVIIPSVLVRQSPPLSVVFFVRTSSSTSSRGWSHKQEEGQHTSSEFVFFLQCNVPSLCGRQSFLFFVRRVPPPSSLCPRINSHGFSFQLLLLLGIMLCEKVTLHQLTGFRIRTHDLPMICR